MLGARTPHRSRSLAIHVLLIGNTRLCLRAAGMPPPISLFAILSLSSQFQVINLSSVRRPQHRTELLSRPLCNEGSSLLIQFGTKRYGAHISGPSLCAGTFRQENDVTARKLNFDLKDPGSCEEWMEGR